MLRAWAIATCFAACGGGAPRATLDAAATASPAADSSQASEIERSPACARELVDDILQAFCDEARPPIRSLVDLQKLLHLEPRPPANEQPTNPVTVLMLGHSTALSGHLISPINPRVILLGGRTQLAFQRGVQRVELATFSSTNNTFNFYLLTFEQACDADGCTPGDLFSLSVESGWQRVTLQADEDLKNTVADCRQCHQRGRETSTLLMRELQRPWTHFFDPTPDADSLTRGLAPGVTGRDLMDDFERAKGDEAYGGVNLDLVNRAFLLEQVVGMQPLVFDAPRIQKERFPNGSTEGSPDPASSVTWERAYEMFQRGEQLALPYVEPRASDPGKQAQLSAAYARFRADELTREELPDLADIFPDDPHVRARIGLQTEPDATPTEALIQACGTCHNAVLDQSLSRARFSIDLARLERAELDLAVARIDLPRDAPGAMPPPEARQLDPQAREQLRAYLRAEQRAAEDDEQLARAASLGMLGPYP